MANTKKYYVYRGKEYGNKKEEFTITGQRQIRKALQLFNENNKYKDKERDER